MKSLHLVINKTISKSKNIISVFNQTELDFGKHNLVSEFDQNTSSFITNCGNKGDLEKALW